MRAGDILMSDQWTRPEKEVVAWQFDMVGDFKKSLWDAIIRADNNNLEKIRLGFPELVEGYLLLSEGDLATRLRKAGLDI